MYTLRFDMRAPQPGVPRADLYDAALEMSTWAESHDCLSIVISEHHGSSDGYLPSPLVLAAAVAARTTTLPIIVGAVLVPLYDSVKLAEDMIVLDIISRGRVSHIIGLGYRPEEYELFGVDFSRRGSVMDDKLSTLRAAVSGDPFVHHGVSRQITPSPFTAGGPPLVYGGHSLAAARRAGRLGLDLFAESEDPGGLADAYRAAAAAARVEPGNCLFPSASSPTSLFVAENVDRAWEEIGPYMLHDAEMYAAWMGRGHDAASKSEARSVEALRDEDGSYRIVTPDEAVAMARSGNPLSLHPLCGGLPPDLAWESLRLVGEQVMPALTSR